MFGNPRTVVTDNGSSFVSGELDKFLKQQGISHHTSSVYNPASNGVVERMHHTLKNRLQKLLFDGMPFMTALQEVLFSMRSNVHDAIGQSPFSRFFGRECRTSFSILSDRASVRSSPRNYKRIYNRKDSSRCAKVISFQPGDQVVWRRGTQGIFAQRAVVRSKVGRSAYILQSPEGKLTTVNQRFIRPVLSSTLASSVVDESYRDITLLQQTASKANSSLTSPAEHPVPERRSLPPRNRRPPSRYMVTSFKRQ